MRQWLSMCMTTVLLVFGLAAGLGDPTPVQAAAKIPISSVEDFLNMESNPSGSYYLTKDITLPKNMVPMFPYDMPFTGTLDGKGHKLKYTFESTAPDGSFVYVGIFSRAKKATFKNLSLANVNINIDAGEGGAKVHPLVIYDEYCKYDKVKASGTITVKASGKNTTFGGSELAVSGLIGSGSYSKLTNCSSSIKIKVSAGYTEELLVGGIAAHLGGENVTAKNCSFSGEISVSAKTNESISRASTVAGICADFSQTKVSGCTNSGNITVKMQKGSIAAYGIGGGYASSMSSCGNSGKIKATTTVSGHANAAGLAEAVKGDPKKATLTKCWNKGGVSATGDLANAGGLCINANSMNQCYNKGAVSVSCRSKSETEIGGLCVSAYRIQNCYNAGKVTLKGTGWAAGLARKINSDYGDLTSNYSTGAVSVKGGKYGFTSSFFLGDDGLKVIMKSPRCYVYDNYYTASTKCSAYGIYGEDSVTKRIPRATKVSSITSKNCPKLSSKYWIYSSKYKRMILKNNKEK